MVWQFWLLDRRFWVREIVSSKRRVRYKKPRSQKRGYVSEKKKGVIGAVSFLISWGGLFPLIGRLVLSERWLDTDGGRRRFVHCVRIAAVIALKFFLSFRSMGLACGQNPMFATIQAREAVGLKNADLFANTGSRGDSPLWGVG